MPTDSTDQITHARRAVRQQAETAAMLGVDFVPCFRTGAGIAEVAAPSGAAATTGDDPARADARQAMDTLRARYEADAPHARFATPHKYTNLVWGDGDVCGFGVAHDS